MSIAILKKKALSQKDISHGSQIFSINGTHRSQGYVGQTVLARHFTQSKGASVFSVENANTVKPSVVSTNGLISTKYRWTRRGSPYTTVKNVDNNGNTQSNHIFKIKQKAFSCDISENKQLPCKDCNGNIINTPIVAIPEVTGALDYSDYLSNKLSKCIQANDEIIITSLKRSPFAC